MTAHVAVIGAGIVGVSTAIQLRRQGFDVTLIDRDGPAAGTSYGNAGVLASCSMVPVTGPGLVKKAPRMLFDPMQPLFLRWGYLPKLMPWLIKYLSHSNEADTRRIGEAVAGVVGDSLAEHQALASGTAASQYIVESDYTFAYNDRAAFEADWLAWDIRRKAGVAWTELEGEAFQDYDACVPKQFGFGVACGDHGRITDPGAYVKALAVEAEALGAKFIKAAIEDIARENGSVVGVRAGGEKIACDQVVIATGVWSGPLTKKLGLKIPLEAERGYHLELWEPSFIPKQPLMIAS
ncbi:MAG: FAD-dependent oxidoreductase, partial [Pseudomonadota bacterium]